MASQKGWRLNPGAFEKLLAILDSNRERAGDKYVTIRAGLIRMFEGRGCRSAETLADQTIDRVTRRIEEGEQIRAGDPAVYFYGVARYVLKEYWTDLKKESAIRQAWPIAQSLVEDSQDLRQKEWAERLECLEHCLETLREDSRNLIARYHRLGKQGKSDGREQLARSLGISLESLRMRSHRIRRVLESCVKDCLQSRANA